jgi:hypothetical protein
MSDSLIDAMSTMREQEALDIARALLDGDEDPLKILDDCSQAMIDFSREYGVYC